MNAKKATWMKAVLAGGVALTVGLSALAEDYELASAASGVAADFGDPAIYGRDTGLPGSGDRIRVGDGLVLTVTDDNIASLSARGTMIYLTTQARMEINLTTNAELKVEFSFSGSADCAGVIKTGAGILTLKTVENPTYDNDKRFIGANARWHIKGGALVLPQEITGTSTISLVDIDAGCEVVNCNGMISMRLTGWGDFVHQGAKTGRITLVGAMDFYGRLLERGDGYKHMQIYAGNGACLYGTGSTSYSASRCTGGLVGLGSFGVSGDSSSIGTSLRFYLEGDSHLLCLGTADETTNKIIIPGSKVQTLEVDGGAYGGVTFTGAWDPTGSMMRSLVLSGSNTAHACVLSNTLADVEGSAYHILKKGTGVWTMAKPDPKWSGALTVEEGTLRFNSIAPAGTACSLGYATNLYANVPGVKDAANAVDWAVCLGNPGAGEVATLEYAGGEAAEWPANRPISVNGRARFRNGSNAALSLAGVTAASNGSVLALDGDAASVNTVQDVVSGTGSLKLVKEGEGTWLAKGTMELADGVDVRAGELRLDNRKNFDWFKVTVKQTFKNYYEPTYADRSSVYIQEFAFYDVNGARCNTNPTLGDPQVGDAAGTLAPGGIAYGPCATGKEVINKTGEYYSLTNMAINDVTHSWGYKANWAPNPEDSSTWVSFVQRMPEGTAEIASFDLRYWKLISETDSNSLYAPRILTISGSANGTDWTDLLTVTNRALTKAEGDSYYNWIHGDHQRFNYVRDPENSGTNFVTKAVIPAAERSTFQIAGAVGVASGATLSVLGEPLTVSCLEIDLNAGCGAYANVALADTGSIVLKNMPTRGVTMPVDFSGLSNFDALTNWTIVDAAGEPVSRQVTISRTSVSVIPNGMIFICR